LSRHGWQANVAITYESAHCYFSGSICRGRRTSGESDVFRVVTFGDLDEAASTVVQQFIRGQLEIDGSLFFDGVHQCIFAGLS
jgi:hypothetical protein